MVEKAGHKGAMQKARMGWIDEGKPRTDRDAEDDVVEEERREPERIAPIFEKRTWPEGRETPEGEEDPFGGEDIYGATPRGKTTGSGDGRGVEPDEDDLDALMAEVEGSTAPRGSLFGGPKPAGSLFGGPGKTAPPAGNEPDEDDLDALMAEAETTATTSRPIDARADGTVSSGAKAAATAESEADDDLDALMAEVEAGGSSRPAPAKTSASDPPHESFADEEEAMAEMEGLW
jgi:replication fork protection complex subunit Csm3/Swi3